MPAVQALLAETGETELHDLASGGGYDRPGVRTTATASHHFTGAQVQQMVVAFIERGRHATPRCRRVARPRALGAAGDTYAWDAGVAKHAVWITGRSQTPSSSGGQ